MTIKAYDKCRQQIVDSRNANRDNKQESLTENRRRNECEKRNGSNENGT